MRVNFKRWPDGLATCGMRRQLHPVLMYRAWPLALYTSISYRDGQHLGIRLPIVGFKGHCSLRQVRNTLGRPTHVWHVGRTGFDGVELKIDVLPERKELAGILG